MIGTLCNFLRTELIPLECVGDVSALLLTVEPGKEIHQVIAQSFGHVLLITFYGVGKDPFHLFV